MSIARFVLVAVVLAGCTDLPDIQARVCGNGVVEPGEDCDHNDLDCVECSWECDEDLQCPKAGEGFHCGVDHLCHGPSGDFDTTPRGQQAFPVLGFRITDIDEDGIGDVVGLNPTALNTRYGDASGELPDSYNVVTPQVTGHPVLTHLLAEDVDDVIMPTADGLVVFTAAFGVPSPRPIPLGGAEGPENMGGRLDPFDAVQIEETIGMFRPDRTTQYATFGIIVLTPTGPSFDVETSDLCGFHVATKEHNSDDTWVNASVSSYRSTNGSTYVTFSNKPITCVIEVSLAPSPIPRGQPGCPTVMDFDADDCMYQVRSVQSFPTFSERAVLADIDGTGCPSLFVASQGHADVYRGSVGAGGCDIDGTVFGQPLPLTNDLLNTKVIGSIRLDPQVNGVGPDAVITSYGIHGVRPPPSDPVNDPWLATRQLYVSDREVHRSVVGDVDGDGNDDVVFATDQPNLDVARRVPGMDTFLRVRTATSGPVVQTVIADYDGDQRLDLAFVESLGDKQRLSIAYGSAAGLEPGIAADVFTRVEFMSHMQVRDSTDPLGIVDDLIVIDFVQQTAPEITILHGSPSRTMLSFFGLPVPIPGSAFRGVAAGDFIDQTPLEQPPPPEMQIPIDKNTAGITDLVAFQTFTPSPICAAWGCNTLVWILPGMPGARIGDAQLTKDSGVGLPLLPIATHVGHCTALTTYDFCVENAKLFAWHSEKPPEPRDPMDKAAGHDIVMGIDFRTDGPAHVLRFDPAAAPWTEPVPFVGPFAAGGRIHDPFVFDFEGDGIDELVAPFSPTSAGGHDGHVEICHMTADGQFDGPCADVATDVVRAESDVECIDATVGDVLPVCTPEGKEQQVLVLCRRALNNAMAMATTQESFVVRVSLVEGQLAGNIGEAVLTTDSLLDEIQIGDVNGDAVDDIVAIDIGGGSKALEVFVQRENKELNICFFEE